MKVTCISCTLTNTLTLFQSTICMWDFTFTNVIFLHDISSFTQVCLQGTSNVHIVASMKQLGLCCSDLYVFFEAATEI